MGVKRENNSFYTALGDSISVGVRARNPSHGFVQRYAARSEEVLGKSYHVHNFAVNGFTTEDVLYGLAEGKVKDAVIQSEIITISAGGNDLLKAGKRYLLRKDEAGLARTVAQCRQNMTDIVQHIRALKENSCHRYMIRLLNMYNPYRKWDIAHRWIRHFNEMMLMYNKVNHVKVVDLYTPFLQRERELLSWDSIHPNEEGHDVIAEAVFRSGYRELRSRKRR
ncbi:lysophospholipase [Fictibacillus macauensis ZFHKF-1]|uniref:Lysophospholipase n=1 Tax=Fictibacillus macauensis ZFHKF-1 TaxID=1196324 RepID=I8UIZ2_9BACL|nr:SGNH/GDSL hydrolase family protein [Fictibacillus macauensis]EIT86798.1 lysophospholipase [Fictibacillus macauensis ZFHKF-1]